MCKIHSNFYSFYCIKCKKNTCIYCKNEHIYHDLIDLSKEIYSDENKKKIEENIKNIELQINSLDTIKNEIIKRIHKMKESNEFEIKLIKLLLYSYKYEESQNNLNFNIIQNLKNFEKIYRTDKIFLFEQIYKQGNIFISYLDKLQNYKSNSFTNNFKSLQNHTFHINYLSKLKDGRLASCSSDYSFNIYKNNTFDLQFSIKEHSHNVKSFTQLNDGRIITCSDDHTMKIIKLVDENKYKVEQELKEHSGGVDKVIEIKDNELISVSGDKTMKIWKIIEEDKFSCIKTLAFQNNNNSNCNILKLNDNEFVTSSQSDGCVKFYNLNNYLNIETINNIGFGCIPKNLCLINDDILCVCGNKYYLIKISNHQLIKYISGPSLIYSIHECIDGLFLCSVTDNKNNHNLVKYKYENENLIIIEEKIQASDKTIYDSIELNDGTIASGGSGDNYSIKLWSN